MEHDTEPTKAEPTEAEETDTEPTETEPTEAEPTEAPGATGDPRVDSAIAHLSGLRELPVSEHPPVFERIHGQLVEVLGELHTGASLADSAEPAESAEG
jgi:hypothetical protein